MDYEGCYLDPEKGNNESLDENHTMMGGVGGGEEGGGIAAAELFLGGGESSSNHHHPSHNNKAKSGATTTNTTHVIPPLHPDDEALINWKGSMGDTAAEQLQQKRDRARAAARLAISQGYGSLAAANAAAATPSSRGGKLGSIAFGGGGKGGTTTTPNSMSTIKSGVMKLKKKHHLHSRILDEQTPHFMKKTTYLTNTATSVHQFTSLAHTQEQRAREVDRALAETSERYKKEDMIEMGFVEANSWDVKGVVVDKNTAAVVVAGGDNTNNNKKRRVHPSKKGVYPVWDLPLLPDVPTWGHTYAHVVLDHPPKSVSNAASTTTTPKKKREGGENHIVTAHQLQKAIVADVSKQAQNSRMACTIWVPDSEEGGGDDKQTPLTKKAKMEESESYQAVQRYDLDVLPLRDPSGPQVHYVWMIDPSKKYVGYHPVGSRVQLSTGRPIVLAAAAGGSKHNMDNDATVVTNESIIYRRAMEIDEKKEVEKRMAEVDVDMAEKYGLVVEDDLQGEKKGGESGGVEKGKKAAASSDSDAELEKDAF
jgi:RNA polymerase II-associated factor 1